MEKIIELQAKFEQAKKEAQELLDAGKVQEAQAKMEEAKSFKAAIELQKTLDQEEAEALRQKEQQNKGQRKEKDSIKEFADAARRGFQNSMNEGTPADGGYTVPEDIQTKINTYREAKFSLLNLVDVEKVSTNTGRRTYKKRAQQTGFTQVNEGGKISASATPQFETVEYNIKKYAGYCPVTNELLQDSNANISNFLINWLGDESRVTANKLIITLLKTQGETALKGLDDIKKVLNVTLGSAFKATSKIVTNDDGLQYLDTLKDGNGRYLLAPNPANPQKVQLSVGATVIPVEVIPNADLPTETQKIPFIIGDLHEAVKYWDRQQRNIARSDVAQIGELNAFEQDLTIFRAIEREDVTFKDKNAFVYGVLSAASK